MGKSRKSTQVIVDLGSSEVTADRLHPKKFSSQAKSIRFLPSLARLCFIQFSLVDHNINYSMTGKQPT